MNNTLKTTLSIFTTWIFWCIIIIVRVAFSKNGIKLDAHNFTIISGMSAWCTFLMSLIIAILINNSDGEK